MIDLLLSLAQEAHAKRPPPVGPVPDPVAVAASKGFAKKVAKAPDERLPSLVERLVGDTDDEATKVRRIHDWIALTIAYDADAYYSKERLDPGVASTLSRGKAVCAGYAEVFEAMASLAGLETRVVTGYARGAGYDPFREDGPFDEGHAWNVVRVDGEWRFVDTTWDAGDLENRRFERDYETEWLFTDPAVFVHTHLPADPAMQLLPEPVDVDTFRALAHVKPPLGTTITFVEAPRALSVVDNHAQVSLRVEGDVQVDGFLHHAAEGNPLVPGGAFADADGDATRIRVRFPEPGDYILRIGVKRPGEEGYTTKARLAFTAREASADGLPIGFTSWLGAYELVSPDGFAAGTPAPIVVRLPGVTAAWVRVGEGELVPLRRDGDVFTSEPLDPARGPITVMVGVEGGRWMSILEYPPR